MKPLQKFVFFIAVIFLFASCQSASKPLRGGYNNSEMTQEMMETMMNNKKSMMAMGNHDMMMKIMKSNPVMMDSMMADMMEICKKDSTMMSGMCKTMMENKPMMDMMHKMEEGKIDMNKMEGRKHKM